MVKKPQFRNNLESIVYSLLIAKGYPPDSIVFEPEALKIEGERQYRPDFLIVDPFTNEHLAIIEVKGQLANLSHAKEQLELYKQALGSTRAATYLLTNPLDVPDKISVFKSDSDTNGKNVDPQMLPTFEALRSSNVASKKSKIVFEQDETTDALRRTGIILAVLTFLIAAADFTLSFWGVQLITPERITLLGAALFLIIVPYFQKFKALGIEWERATGETANKSGKGREQ